MRRLRSILPAPGILLTFEAAGRQLSFTAAAKELNVTRAAVSQQIRSLETFLGVQLFNRMHRSLRLTPGGVRYHRAISAVFTEAVRATNELRRTSKRNTVTVTATQGFATFWLMPSVGEFRQRHPEIELRFVISDRYLDLIDENIDIAIRYGEPPFENADATLLVREEINPTCAPELIRGKRVLRPAKVATYPLIHLDGPYDRVTCWSHWFQVHGLIDEESHPAITVNTYSNLVQAALNGQGFALIGPPLVSKYLADGLLIQPVRATPIPRQAFYIVIPRGSRPSAAALKFAEWIREKHR